MIIEYSFGGCGVVKLHWHTNGDLTVIQTGDPEIDELPFSLRLLTSAYQRTHKRRYNILFDILSRISPPPTMKAEHYETVFSRLRKTINYRKMQLEQVVDDPIHELTALIRYKLYPENPRKTIYLIWQLIDNYPNFVPRVMDEKLLQYYFPEIASVQKIQHKAKSFLGQLRRRSQIIALEHVVFRTVAERFFPGQGIELLKYTSVRELYRHLLEQYHHRLIQYLDGAAPWSVAEYMIARSIRCNLLKPVLSQIQNKPHIPQWVRELSECVLASCSELEETYERREK